MKISFKEVEYKNGILRSAVLRDDFEPCVLYVKLPMAVKELKEDLISLFFATLAGKRYRYISIDLPLPVGCKNIIEKFCNAEVNCFEGKQEIRPEGNNYSLSFSGGFDSLAAKALLPKNTKLISLDFGGKFARERTFFERFNPYIIETNIVELGLNKNHWAFMSAGIILLRDYLSIKVASFGSILASSIPSVLSKKIIKSRFILFDYLNIDTFNPLAGITEIGAMSIALGEDLDGYIVDSLSSLANPKEGKFYRKTMALKAYLLGKSHNYILPNPKPRGWYRWGENYADDLSAIYIYQQLGKGSIEESYLDDIPEIVFQKIRQKKFNFYFRYNVDAYGNIKDEYKNSLFDRLSNLEFYEYEEDDYKDLLLVDYLIRNNDNFYTEISSQFGFNSSGLREAFLKGSGIHCITKNNIKYHIKVNRENIPESRALIISFNGPVRANSNQPLIFDNEKILTELGLPYIIFTDPVVENSPEVNVGWYLGCSGISDFSQEIAIFLDYLSNTYQIPLFLIGGLNGGFAALRIQQLLKESSNTVSIVWNPHTNLDHYYSNLTKSYLHSAFHNKSIKSINSKYNLPLKINANCKVVLLCNGYDNNNIRYHIKPFVSSCNSIANVNLDHCIIGNSIIYFGDWGVGHITPDLDFLIKLIREIAEERNLEAVFSMGNPDKKQIFIVDEFDGVPRDVCALYYIDDKKINIRCLLKQKYFGYQIKVNIKSKDEEILKSYDFLGSYDNECILEFSKNEMFNFDIEVVIEDLLGKQLVVKYPTENFRQTKIFKVF